MTMEIELLVILRGLQLCFPLGLHDLMVESNSVAVGESMSLLGNLIKDVKDLMQKNPRCTIQHTGRVANEAAHRMVRHAWSL